MLLVSVVSFSSAKGTENKDATYIRTHTAKPVFLGCVEASVGLNRLVLVCVGGG